MVIGWLSCGCRVVVVWLSYGCRVVIVLLSCGCRVVVVWLSCGCRVVVVCLSCGCRVVVGELSYFRRGAVMMEATSWGHRELCRLSSAVKRPATLLFDVSA